MNLNINDVIQRRRARPPIEPSPRFEAIKALYNLCKPRLSLIECKDLIEAIERESHNV